MSKLKSKSEDKPGYKKDKKDRTDIDVVEGDRADLDAGEEDQTEIDLKNQDQTPKAEEKKVQADINEKEKEKAVEGEEGGEKLDDKETDLVSLNTAAPSFVGLIIWIVIILVVGYWIWWPERADVLINVSAPANTADKLPVSVTAMHNGTILREGVVHLSVRVGKRKEHYYSINLAKQNDGQFNGEIPYQPPANGESIPIRMQARYIGYYQDNNEQKPVNGSAYLNIGTPARPSQLLVSILLSLGALMAVILIAIFTGIITRGKARALFGLMYFITFLAMVVPLVAVIAISNSPYLTDIMTRAPIGLVSGVAPPSISQEQWLLNIGGAVSKSEEEKTAGGIPGISVTKHKINGGLAIPFYVIMLSLFGAAINMTRRVPAIQRDSVVMDLPGEEGMSMFGLILRAPAAAFHPSKQYKSKKLAKQAAELRADAISQFMYLLSAPFLAVAVYFLLQAAADEVSTPVLVVMGFATGLMSDRIVAAILHFARTTVGRDESNNGQGEAATSQKTPQEDQSANNNS